MKIAIFGDSFSARILDHSIKGWPIQLEEKFSVDNFSTSGSSQYRILQTIKTANLENYDRIIISHTSPLRMFVRYNPLHQNTQYHQACDLIFQDIENRNDEFSRAAQGFYKHLFDIEYAINIHNLICNKIDQLTGQSSVLNITHFDYTDLYQFDNMINFYKDWKKHRGTTNHYTQDGNNLVYQRVLDNLVV